MDPRTLPIPPFDMPMPDGAQRVFLIGNVLACVIAIIAAERYRRQTGSPVGFLLLLAGAATVINEPVVDILGLCYAYYGRQPFRLLEFPLWWPICNGLIPIVMAALAFRLQPILTGVRCLLIVPLGPMVAGMTNGAIATPVWVALNSGAPLWGTSLAGLTSLCLGLSLAFLVSRIVAVDTDPTAIPQEIAFG